ncbi:MAG: DUF4013 domain-containing protein [Methanoregula sp.]|jgi:hypothetical protein|uniref:DUF4013 domain-containing protein n=1 Tax=Methanoregula sp. TaxID=2052170 RepID=UPI003D11876D
MDYGKMLGEAFGYAKEGLVGKWMKWVLLLVATILLALPLLGYELKIYRGEKPAPEVTGWATLFIDGIKYLIICLIYAIPVIIVAVITIWPLVMAAIAGNQAAIAAGIGTFLTSIVVLAIIGIIIALFEFIGVVRFARTGKMGEAFNFSAIIGTIGKIGWVSYIVALIIMMVIVGIIEMICMAIPFVGGLILFILIPFIVLFEARYLCQVYDSAGN